MERDHIIEAKISISDPLQSTAHKMLSRKGRLHFNAHEQSFKAVLHNKILEHLLPCHLCKLRRERCPNGACYVIRFQKGPYESIKELALKEIAEPDKTLVHSILLSLVGVEEQTVLRRVPQPANHVEEQAVLRRVPQSAIHVEEQAVLRRVPQSAIHVEEQTALRRVPHCGEKWKEPAQAAMVQLHKLEVLHVEKERDNGTANVDEAGSSAAKNTLAVQCIGERVHQQNHRKKQQNFTTPLSSMSSFLDKLVDVDNTALVRHSPDQPQKQFVHQRGVKRPFLADSLADENKENNNYVEISRPDYEATLPELFIRSNFWAELKQNKRLCSGEWVKGQNEQLTWEGLISLRDGAWLSADIIDLFLDRICQQSAQAQAQFIPTYAILRYVEKGKVSSKWYWQLGETSLVFAPAYLNKSHWAMAVLNMRERTLRLMDSLNHGQTEPSDAKTEFMDNIMNLIGEVAAQQGVDIGERSAWDVQELMAVPQQQNGSDCGIFALLFARYSLEGRAFDFEQRHIPYFRRRICHDIISPILNEPMSPILPNDVVLS